MHTVIIGGTRGLGREVARHFSAQGHKVSVIGRKAPADADSQLPGVRYWLRDVTSDQLTATLDEALAYGGPVNHLVFLQRFKGEGDQWAGEMATSLNATRLAVEHLTPRFAAGEDCSVVLVGSIVGRFVSEGQPVGYHVAKGAVAQMAKFYAVTLGRKGIRVNCVSPCTFVKEENAEFYNSKSPAIQELFKETIPLGRMGTSGDSTGVIAFLCSPAASFVTGQEIVVDGGVSLLSQEALARKLRQV
jgi:NAD(P)-dependent dehydrogenase (short-subunit alcohol dehydrogenase family)